MILNNYLGTGVALSSQIMNGGVYGSRIDRSKNSRIINDLSSRPAEISEENGQKITSQNN